jgi:hypothetical protein
VPATSKSRKKRQKTATQVDIAPSKRTREKLERTGAAERAGELASAYITAAKNTNATNSLRWIAFDGHNFEVLKHGGNGKEDGEQWLFSECTQARVLFRATGSALIDDPVDQSGWAGFVFALAADN